MKRFLHLLTIILAVVLCFTSCKKEEVGFPSNLSGTWTYSNSSSGYTGELYIENISGGQYAYFELNSPVKTLVDLEGSFIYDSTTGVGTIRSIMVGANTVTAQASRGTDKTLEVTVSKIVSGGSEQLFNGIFSKK